MRPVPKPGERELDAVLSASVILRRVRFSRIIQRRAEIVVRRSANLSLRLSPYNLHMARGWESKSVEEQQAQAAVDSRKPRPSLTPRQMANERQHQLLTLARRQIQQQREMARDPRHREMLDKALAHLDAQLAQLG